MQSTTAFLVPLAAPRAPLPGGHRLDEPIRIDQTLAHTLAQRLIDLHPEMFAREQEAAARAATLTATGAAPRHSASVEPLPSPMDSEVSSASQSMLPAIFTAPREVPSTRPRPDSSEEQRNLDEVRHLLNMSEEELFGDGRPYRAAGSIERLLLVTRRFTKYEVTLYDLAPAFMSWVLDEHGSMMAWLMAEVDGPARWERLQLMSTVVAWDPGFSSSTICRNAMDHRTAGLWRFHVLGEHMRERILYRISTFYSPRAANRPLRSLVHATRGEFSASGVYLTREDLRAATLPTPAQLARLPAAPRAAAGMQTGPRPSSQATSSRAASATRDSNLEITSSTSSLSLSMQHPMPDNWVVVDHLSTLYEHIPSGRRFRAPLRVVVRSSNGNIAYDKFVNLEAAGVARWLPTASDHQACPPDTPLVDYQVAWRELDQLLRDKLIVVGDADKVLRELRFRVDNGHLFEVNRSNAVRDALRQLTAAPFTEDRLQQRAPLPLAQIFTALCGAQATVEDLHTRTHFLGRIYRRVHEVDEFDRVRMRDFTSTRSSLSHSWLVNLSQGEPVFDLASSLSRENDRGDRVRALPQAPREEQAWDTPNPPAAKQPRLEPSSASSASAARAPPSSEIGPILRIGPLHADPSVLSRFEEQARRRPLLWKLFLRLLVNEGGLDEAAYKRVCLDSVTRRANLINIVLDEHPNEVHDVLLLIVGMAEEDLVSALTLVERGPGQAIFMREPSQQWPQSTYGDLLPFIRSREAARTSSGPSAPTATGRRQASSSGATDHRTESSTTPAEAASTGRGHGRGSRNSQTAAGGVPSSPRQRRPSPGHPGRLAGTGAAASPTRSEGEIADDADAAASREEREDA